jgi:hypothetical protein
VCVLMALWRRTLSDQTLLSSNFGHSSVDEKEIKRETLYIRSQYCSILPDEQRRSELQHTQVLSERPTRRVDIQCYPAVSLAMFKYGYVDVKEEVWTPEKLTPTISLPAEASTTQELQRWCEP